MKTGNRRFRRMVGIFTFCSTLLLFLTLISESPAQISSWFREDLTIQEKSSTTGGPQGSSRETTATIYLTSKAFRRSASDGTDSIFRFEDQKIISIDHKKKSYTEISMEELQKKMDESFQAMNKQGGEDSKQAMEAMKKMFGGIGDSVKVTKVGPGDKILGYSTEKYEVEMGVMKIQMWCAPDLKMPEVYYDSIKMRMPKNPMFDMGKLYDEMKKINGYPLKQIHTMNMMGMAMNTTSEVTSVQKGSVPASTFTVPSGYKLEPHKF
jgi:hypothetical protein